MRLKITPEERLKTLSSREVWGEDALPALTIRQARLLLDALADMYAVGVMHGQMTEQRFIRRMNLLGYGDPRLTHD